MERIKAIARTHAPVLLIALKKIELRLKSTEQVFTQIYTNNKWGNAESVSGLGSTLAYTQTLRHVLPSLLERLHCKSILDIPCGDFGWMSHIQMDIDYIGADIVAELIKRNQRLYGSSIRRFEHLDLLRDRLPRADIILCRECFVHLSDSDCLRAMKNIRMSGAHYLLATTYPNLVENQNILTGQWRPLNLEIPPFSLPRPIELISEYSPDYSGKSLALWNLQTL